MTSVAVISSAVVRINCLNGQFETLPDGVEELLGILNEVKESLINADGKKADVERDIVNLSYDIVDAIADAVVSKIATKKLRDLKDPLIRLHNKLKNIPEPEYEQNRIDEKKKSAVSYILDVAKCFGCRDDPNTKKQTTSDSEQNHESENKKVENSDESIVKYLLFKHEEKEDSMSDVDIVEWQRGNSSPVLYIVGESGMGKSTCARRLFDELRNHSSYDVCTWVSINHTFKTRRVLQVLLHKLTPRQGLGIGDMNEMELIAQISSILKVKNYLLVLDDVRSVRDWESFRVALPISDSSRVIITSSDMDFTSLGAVYKIPSMTLSGIRQLLKEEGSFQPGLESHAETIFKASGGSPLLAIILGKSLQSEAIATRQQLLVDELNSDKPPFGEPTVLAACYKWLAPELKPCLLYLSQFPWGQEIEVEKLYLLLAAESLILSPRESKIGLDSLIRNLDELASRNLVEVQEDIMSRRGNHKSYRLQFQVHKFCIWKTWEEKFLKIVNMESRTKYTRRPTTRRVEKFTRRLVIRLSKTGGNVSIQFDSQDISKEIMSLSIYDTSESDEKSELPEEINDLKEFIHLRILKFDGVNFGVHNAPTGIDTLVLLRYLSFRGCRLKELPPSLSKLTQLETLDLVVQADCEMLIHNNILTHMKRMLHLYFPKLYKRSDDKTKIQLKNLESLEILVNFDAEVCEVGALPKFKQLIILSTMSDGDPRNLNGIADFINTQADLLKYSSVDIRSFDYYDNERVLALEKLLRCKFIHALHIEGRIGKLPEPKEDNRKNNTLDNVVGSSEIEANLPAEDNRQTKISDIVLDGSEIEADPMKYLGMFEKLQSLVLKNDAIVENVIVIPKAATIPLFCKLRSLKLQNLNYLQTLTIEEGAMPKLSSLQIDSCASLEKLSIPKELDDRLKKAQGDDERNVYSIMPLPTGFEITE